MQRVGKVKTHSEGDFVIRIRRHYRAWVANESLEDYSLRYAARSYRKWSPYLLASTALGEISFLALEAIGAAITISPGFANAFPATMVAVVTQTLGGTIDVESEVGVGTTFTLRFPRILAAPASPSNPRSPRIGDEPDVILNPEAWNAEWQRKIPAPPRTALVVDDDPAVHEVTRILLARASFENRSVTLHHAYSAEEARDFLDRHPETALVLLDVVMETDDAGLRQKSNVTNEKSTKAAQPTTPS